MQRSSILIVSLLSLVAACADEKLPARKNKATVVKADGTQPPTGSGSGSTPDDALPPAPPPAPAAVVLGDFEIAAIPPLTGQTSFKLTWSASTEATAYDVLIAPDVACTGTSPTYPDLVVTEIDVPRLESGEHFVCVTAKHASGVIHAAKNTGLSVLVPANVPPTAGTVTVEAVASPFLAGASLTTTGVITSFTDPDLDVPRVELFENGCGFTIEQAIGATEFLLINDAMPDKPCTLRVGVRDELATCATCEAVSQQLSMIGLVKDVNGEGDVSGLPEATPPAFAALPGNVLAFTATTRTNGTELWKTSGNEAGTALVTDLVPGNGGLAPAETVALGTVVYFRGYDEAHGFELWKSDGTAAGTVLVKDIAPGAASSSPTHITVLGAKLYFAADDGTNGVEPWSSDGTSSGTVLLRDVATGATDSNPADFALVDATIYFAAETAAAGREPWVSDGTSAGTTILMDLGAAAAGSDPHEFRSFDGRIYFVATSAAAGTEIFSAEPGSPPAALEINAGATGGDPAELTVAGTNLFFRGTEATKGTELMVIEASAIPAISVIDSLSGSGGIAPRFLYASGNDVFFFAEGVGTGLELWSSVAGVTAQVKEINAGAAPSIETSYPQSWASFGGSIFFVADDGAKGYEVWKTDGTSVGTIPLKDVRPGADASRPRELFVLGPKLYFTADDGSHGREIWVSDATEAGTILLKDVENGNGDALAANPATPALARLSPTSSAILFTADDGANGAELWKSDGTVAGTTMIKDVRAGGGGSAGASGSHQAFALTETKILFAADDGTNGLELWSSDGSAAGTSLVKDIQSGSGGSSPSGFAKLGSLAFFTANAGSGAELWKSDGTAGGTEIVRDIRSSATLGSNPDHLRVVGSTLFFTANDGVKGTELWKTTGSTLSTELVIDLAPNAASSDPHELTTFGTKLIFAASATAANTELFTSDGTAAGTSLVLEINPFVASNPQRFMVAAGKLFFVADDGTHGVELWKSDGTEAGTALVKDLVEGAGSADPKPLATLDSRLVFLAADTDGKRFLYVTDGTAAGTLRIFDAELKDVSHAYTDTGAVAKSTGGLVYFQASDAEHGYELWRTDGTAAGTTMLYDLSTGAGVSSFVWSPMEVAGTIFFQAVTPESGRELWKFIAN